MGYPQPDPQPDPRLVCRELLMHATTAEVVVESGAILRRLAALTPAGRGIVRAFARLDLASEAAHSDAEVRRAVDAWEATQELSDTAAAVVLEVLDWPADPAPAEVSG